MPNFIEIGGGSRKFSKKLVDLTRNDPSASWRSSNNVYSLATELEVKHFSGLCFLVTSIHSILCLCACMCEVFVRE